MNTRHLLAMLLAALIGAGCGSSVDLHNRSPSYVALDVCQLGRSAQFVGEFRLASTAPSGTSQATLMWALTVNSYPAEPTPGSKLERLQRTKPGELVELHLERRGLPLLYGDNFIAALYHNTSRDVLTDVNAQGVFARASTGDFVSNNHMLTREQLIGELSRGARSRGVTDPCVAR